MLLLFDTSGEGVGVVDLKPVEEGIQVVGEGGRRPLCASGFCRSACLVTLIDGT